MPRRSHRRGPARPRLPRFRSARCSRRRRVGGDGRQISRYESGRITPSLDALARIAQYLYTSLDHLVFDDIPQRPLHARTNAIDGRLAQITELDDNDQQALLDHLDALLARTRLHATTNTSAT